MNFKVNKKIFLEKLNLAAKAISSTTPLPALTGIKIVAESNTLTIISSDSNISIKSIIDSSEDLLFIEDNGEIVVDTRYILEIVRKIEAEYINLEIMDGTLIKIYGGKSEFKINTMNASDYPNINFSKNENSFKLNTQSFLEIIDQTSFAVSESETRPVLTGVNFKAENNKLYVNATDSYRLASKTIDLDQDLKFNITIPAKYLKEISSSIIDEKEIEIAIDSQKISFTFENTLIQTRLLDDEFPDTNKLIPTNFSQTLTISSRELNSAIDRTSFMKNEGKNIVKMSISKEKVDITSSSNVGSFYENVQVINFEGEPFQISCSGKYLQNALKAIKSSEVMIKFSGELKPMVLYDLNDPNLIQLISPVRTH